MLKYPVSDRFQAHLSMFAPEVCSAYRPTQVGKLIASIRWVA
ncbi:hypothetical protein I543_1843 [Mycobacteroides abscessus 21]|uniref:Uncharacterized protein n=1 Tax=Mycobacteroides abscessus 21 TaxID=1299324 RepID=A0A829PYH7_9MYCO|nr:hypothetical protein I543_1843 [Mycobacteroides abscessus 21]